MIGISPNFVPPFVNLSTDWPRFSSLVSILSESVFIPLSDAVTASRATISCCANLASNATSLAWMIASFSSTEGGFGEGSAGTGRYTRACRHKCQLQYRRRQKPGNRSPVSGQHIFSGDRKITERSLYAITVEPQHHLKACHDFSASEVSFGKPEIFTNSPIRDPMRKTMYGQVNENKRWRYDRLASSPLVEQQ